MILTVDMGNTQIEVGGFEGDRVVFSERLGTNLKKTKFEYAVLIHNMFEILKIDPKSVTGAILSSVVPPLTNVMKSAVFKALGITPLVVGPGLRNGLKIRIDDPKQLGADLVVDAVGALREYRPPLIIIDLGTASTISVIDSDKNFLGGMIIPGVRSSYSSLVGDTSQLPKISMEAPMHLIGTNTVDSMQSGLVYGQAAMLDGLIERLKEKLNDEVQVIITGGLSELIYPFCKSKIIYDQKLVLKGLKAIYDLNTEPAGKAKKR